MRVHVRCMDPWLLLLALLLAHSSSVARAEAPTLAADADRVHFLPGGPAQLDFGLFSGYINVDASAGRELFYVFAEARVEDPTQAPLLLWLNGGPGCSSLGGGFMSELGPFYPTVTGDSLQANPYSWNNFTNVIWLESPAFVGFSYSNKSEDAIVGDARTAADARLFLLHWLARFPQFAAADLYLAGESYAGHYVPNLALEIVRGNKRAPAAAPAAAAGQVAGAAAAAAAGAEADEAVVAGSSSNSEGPTAAAAAAAAGVSPGKGHLNLKGFFVGNAWTDTALDNRGALDFWYSHAMISAEAHSAISENCDFSNIGPLLRGAQALTLPGTHSSSSSRKTAAGACGSLVAAAVGGYASWVASFWQGVAAKLSPSAAAPAAAAAGPGTAAAATGVGNLSDKEVVCARWLDIAQAELGNINIYEIYADVCVAPPTPSMTSDSSSSSSSSSSSYRGALLGHLPLRRRGVSAGPHLPKKPRYDPCIDGEVETYFNLPQVQEALHANQSTKLPWRWTDCSSMISYSRQDLLASMLPVYHELLDASPALKLWVFSGDVDGIVPVLGSRRWIESLHLPVAKPWRPWTSRTGQVGGWRIDYSGLTFATVRNSGHMVPYVTPERAFHLLGEFLYGDRDGFDISGSSSGSSSSSSSGSSRWPGTSEVM